jgi:translation elongation factor EF-Tu-like GTPase
MDQKNKRSVISTLKREILEYLREIDRVDDPDLWQEVAAKVNDVLVVYRHHGKPSQAEPATFTFSDGITRNLSAMAASHAMEQIDDETDDAQEWIAFTARVQGGDEWPAILLRGERGA